MSATNEGGVVVSTNGIGATVDCCTGVLKKDKGSVKDKSARCYRNGTDAVTTVTNEDVNENEEIVQHISITIPETELTQGALQVLATVRPHWQRDDIDFKLLTDGITNKLVGCFLKEDADKKDVVLVRIYGNKTDLLIDRKAETRNILLLHRNNLAPRLYATFENGLSYEYVPGSTLSEEMVRDPTIYQLVAEKMAKMHNVRTPGSKTPKPMLWTKIQQFFKLIPDQFADPVKQRRFQELGIAKPRILEEMIYLEAKLDECKSPVVFCHNDLLLGNVIYNSQKDQVTFIDFEYSAYNYQAFDIGNHFAEFVGLTEIDYSKYPSEEVQKKWLMEYLKVKNNHHCTESVPQADVDKLYVQVNKFCLASHMLWGLWSLIQAEHSHLDFDFIGYFSTRFSEYLKRRDELLALN